MDGKGYLRVTYHRLRSVEDRQIAGGASKSKGRPSPGRNEGVRDQQYADAIQWPASVPPYGLNDQMLDELKKFVIGLTNIRFNLQKIAAIRTLRLRAST